MPHCLGVEMIAYVYPQLVSSQIDELGHGQIESVGVVLLYWEVVYVIYCKVVDEMKCLLVVEIFARERQKKPTEKAGFFGRKKPRGRRFFEGRRVCCFLSKPTFLKQDSER